MRPRSCRLLSKHLERFQNFPRNNPFTSLFRSLKGTRSDQHQAIFTIFLSHHTFLCVCRGMQRVTIAGKIDRQDKQSQIFSFRSLCKSWQPLVGCKVNRPVRSGFEGVLAKQKSGCTALGLVCQLCCRRHGLSRWRSRASAMMGFDGRSQCDHVAAAEQRAREHECLLHRSGLTVDGCRVSAG